WNRAWGAVQADVRALRQTCERPAAAPRADPSSLSRLLEFADWNHHYLRSLETSVGALSQTATHDFLAVGKLVDDLLTTSKKLLMLPVATLGVLLPKVVRDLCRDQGKEAELVIRGADVEVDKRILDALKDPLIHLLRNCVDHGVEPPDRRVALGKPARATV